MENIAWMAWTVPTAIFFVMLSLTLGVMTWLAVAYPEAERIGILRIPTTRGDRLFISLVLAAVIHLLWIAFVGTDAIATLPIGERRRDFEPVARNRDFACSRPLRFSAPSERAKNEQIRDQPGPEMFVLQPEEPKCDT